VKLGLLNLRGSDIPFNPVFFSWVVVKSSGEIHLFVDQNKVTRVVRQHLNLDADVEMKETGTAGNNNVIAVLHSYEEIDSFLKTEVNSWTFF
jgi:(2Fe-2S) ferredoxin